MTKYNIPVGTIRFTKGAVVFLQPFLQNESSVSNLPGHVHGFSLDSNDELQVIVDWANGQRFGVHPHNLQFFQ